MNESFRPPTTDDGPADDRLVQLSDEIQNTISALNDTLRSATTNEVRYRLLLDHLPDSAVYIYDKDQKLCFAGGTLAGLGSTGLEVVGKHHSEFLDPSDSSVVESVLERAFSGVDTSLEVHSATSGRELLLDVAPLPPLEGPDIIEALVMIRDVTARNERVHAVAAAESRWRAIFEGAPAGVAELDNQGQILVANQAMVRFTGRSAGELVGTHFFDLVYVEDRDAVGGRFERVFDNESSELKALQCRIVRSDGALRWALIDVTAVKSIAGAPERLVLHLVDTTEQHRSIEELRGVHDRYSALLAHGSDLIAILDSDLRFRYANPAFKQIFGIEPAAMMGTPLSERLHPEDAAHVIAAFSEAMSESGRSVSLEVRAEHGDGTWRHLEVWATNRLNDPAIQGIVCSCRDVTERVEVAERLSYQAMHDSLTSLPNRMLFFDRLKQALARSERSETRCAVLFIDLDYFKKINDTMGHAAGDELLISVSHRLRAAMRPGDTVARIGGDEFVVLAEGLSLSTVALDIANRIRGVITQPMQISGKTVNIGTSIGIALSNGNSPEALLQAADTALYKAKQRGRDRWELYDDTMGTLTQRNVDTEELLRSALGEDRLVVVYQPIMNLETGEVVATEAFARIQRKDGVLMSAAEFVEVAENSGLMVPLGAAILDAACAQQALWAPHPNHPKQVFVNLSACQLSSIELLGQVQEALAVRGVAPEELCLEVSESSLADTGEATFQSFTELKDLGVKIAVDDFGTGLSSLSHLRRFPIDMIKVDRSFTAGLGSSHDDSGVVRAVIGLGQALGLTTIAEGVETAEQARVLKELGCEFAQGYFWSAPVQPGELDFTSGLANAIRR